MTRLVCKYSLCMNVHAQPTVTLADDNEQPITESISKCNGLCLKFLRSSLSLPFLATPKQTALPRI